MKDELVLVDTARLAHRIATHTEALVTIHSRVVVVLARCVARPNVGGDHVTDANPWAVIRPVPARTWRGWRCHQWWMRWRRTGRWRDRRKRRQRRRREWGQRRARLMHAKKNTRDPVEVIIVRWRGVGRAAKCIQSDLTDRHLDFACADSAAFSHRLLHGATTRVVAAKQEDDCVSIVCDRPRECHTGRDTLEDGLW